MNNIGKRGSKKAEKVSKYLINHSEFWDECQKRRKEFLKTVYYHPRTHKIISYNEHTLNSLTSDLISKFPELIPSKFSDTIKDFFLKGKWEPPKSITKPVVVYEEAVPSGRNKITVEIHKFTTESEYREAWKDVKKIQKWMTEFNPPRPLSDLDLKILELYKKGLTTEKIANELDKLGLNVPELAYIDVIISSKRSSLGISNKQKPAE
jgi:hypothetical protein